MSKKRPQKGKETKNILIFLFVLCVSLSFLSIEAPMGQKGNPWNLIGSGIAIYVMCLVIWYLLVAILKNEKIPYTWLKITVSMAMGGTVSVAFSYIYIYIYIDFQQIVEYNASIAAIFGRGSLIAATYLPLAFLIEQSKTIRQKEKEIARLKQLHLQLQIENLRPKLGPHFLFNTLNVLKSGTNDTWVKEYTIALSNIYRYLIDHQENQVLIHVQAELDFIEAYIHILKARFGKSLNIHIAGSLQHVEGKIPAMTLELLLENAVKHNIISDKSPLKIDIMLEDNWITVRNNIAKKETPDIESNGIGLYSISEQYRLISGKKISIGDNGQYFTVKVPLLTNINLSKT